MLRSSARCGQCGRKGATLQHPSWRGSAVGWEAFPCVPVRLGQQLRASPLDPRGKERCIYDAIAADLGIDLTSDYRYFGMKNRQYWDERPPQAQKVDK